MNQMNNPKKAKKKDLDLEERLNKAQAKIDELEKKLNQFSKKIDTKIDNILIFED